jgi:sugar/nucleoside kinase (ribokinase family)
MSSLDFLAIGDTVVDAFIRLKTAEVVGEPDSSNYKLCIPFAEKIPYESVQVVPAVGNSANAAISAARLGLQSGLVTNIGGDEQGQSCLKVLEENNVNRDLVLMHPDKKTNYHYCLWYGADRTILVKHESYEYKLPDLNEPKWIYLSSLGEQTAEYHKQISEYLVTHPNINLAFQPGTFQINFGVENLKDIYARSNVFFCNVEEAGRILGVHTLGTAELLKRMLALGPKIVVITDGPKGAYASDGSKSYFAPAFAPEETAYERTGAGDAFASATTAALVLGKSLPEALSWGAVNGMNVCRFVGAREGLLTQPQILKLLSEHPEYSIKPLS